MDNQQDLVIKKVVVGFGNRQEGKEAVVEFGNRHEAVSKLVERKYKSIINVTYLDNNVQL